MDTTQTQPNTTAAARELAQELRARVERYAPSATSYMHLALKASEIVTIAATLDALADDNAKLRDDITAAKALLNSIGANSEKP